MAAQDMMDRTWRQGGRREMYSDFNELALRITVGALFGATVESSRARQIKGRLPDNALEAVQPRVCHWVKDRQQQCALMSIPVWSADSIETAFKFFTDRTTAPSLPEWVPTLGNLAYR